MCIGYKNGQQRYVWHLLEHLRSIKPLDFLKYTFYTLENDYVLIYLKYLVISNMDEI